MPCPNCGISIDVSHYYIDQLCQHCEIERQERIDGILSEVCNEIKEYCYVRFDMIDGIIEQEFVVDESKAICMYDGPIDRADMEIMIRRLDMERWKASIAGKGYDDLEMTIWKYCNEMPYEYIVIFERENDSWVIMDRVR
jgi:hypothetical protein